MSWRPTLQLPLALSTLGLPGATLADAVRTAAAGGCQGLELRAAEDQPVHVGLSAHERAVARATIAASGLVTATVASYVCVAAPGSDQETCDALRAHVALAHDLGAHAVRVFADGDPDDVARSDARARTRLLAVAEEAHAAGVQILLETHDTHPRGEDVARILPGTGAGAIWDVVHTWRAGEPLAETARLLAPWLAEVQVKDVSSREDPTPVVPGTGAVPLTELATLLREDFDGWLCLEWERAWHPQIPPVSIALAATHAWLSAPGKLAVR